MLTYVRDMLDMVLIMTVNPGFGGQEFIPTQLQKITAARELCVTTSGPPVRIAVDGGITPDTMGAAYAAGADWIVACSAGFGKSAEGEAMYRVRMDALRNAAV
jgi:ribulose-phosphate 3-epimerase